MGVLVNLNGGEGIVEVERIAVWRSVSDSEKQRVQGVRGEWASQCESRVCFQRGWHAHVRVGMVCKRQRGSTWPRRRDHATHRCMSSFPCGTTIANGRVAQARDCAGVGEGDQRARNEVSGLVWHSPESPPCRGLPGGIRLPGSSGGPFHAHEIQRGCPLDQ
jgi:hypothetical protein